MFLLSEEETEKYLGRIHDAVYGIDHAKKMWEEEHGNPPNRFDDMEWLLRSTKKGSASSVFMPNWDNAKNAINSGVMRVSYAMGVRPAIWVSLY